MQQDTTPVYLPAKLPYPLTVVKVKVKEGDDLTKRTPLVTYKYWDYEPVPLSKQDEGDAPEKGQKVEYVGTYECPCNGLVQSISVKEGDVLENNSKSILEILEPCTHPIQYGGLCAICGKAVDDEEDYNGFNGKDRAPIAMAHGTTNLTVSSREAASIEKSSVERLLQDKKLSLVVDLDQTVIHATVDPTVGEWMADPTNPNYEAIKDVRSFSLEEPAIVPPGYTGPPPPPNIRWYYVKLRPGLKEFLEKASKKYEMHIYTMATRSYAKEIGKIIDPDGIYFGDRILSRDESGSLTQKSLKRLFPVDTSMVVVIDDRGDVWNWSPNLIKVVPYDFFVGIGDINSSFLPRQQALLGPSKRRKSVNILEEKLTDDGSEDGDEEAIEEEIDGEEAADAEAETSVKSTGGSAAAAAAAAVTANDTSAEVDANKDDTTNEEANEGAIIEEGETTEGPDDESTTKIEKVVPEPESESKKSSRRPSAGASVNGSSDTPGTAASPVDRMVEMGGLLAMQASERSTVLEQQANDRPLAKMQQNLEKIIEEEETKKTDLVEDDKETHNLLQDDDNELETLGQALVRIHNEFFFEVESGKGKEEGVKGPDVKDIMNSMKSIVFKNCVFLLSSVLPLGTPLDSADIVIWAKSFGATFVSEYNTSVTHVICKNPGTFKVRLAKSVNPDVKVVNPDWLFSCMSMWEHVSEEPYTVKVDGLMSKEQVDNFLKFHNNVGPSSFDATNLDWDDIDDEMRDFMGSDYEDDEDDEEEEGKGSEKRPADDDEFNDAVTKKQKIEELESEEAADEADEAANEDDEDEYEKEILEDLADLEEDDGDDDDDNDN